MLGSGTGKALRSDAVENRRRILEAARGAFGERGVEATEVARALGLPLLAAMRPEAGLARALERGSAPGRARGPLAAAARAELTELRATAAPAYGGRPWAGRAGA